MVRITQTGTGNAFVVEDSTNPDTTTFVITSAGDVGIGATTPTSKLYVSANNTQNYAIQGISTISSPNGYGGKFFGYNGGFFEGSGNGSGTSALSYGLFASAHDSITNIAVLGIADNNESYIATTNIGAHFIAENAVNNYSLRLQDGTAGINKLLVDVTGNGDANWTSSIKVTSIIASASSTSDIIRITQTGTGNALVVEDNANPDITPFVIDASGNIGAGTASPSTKLHVFSTTSGAVRIVDGTQQAGYVLTSDANGVATWQVSTGGGSSLSGTVNYVPYYTSTTTLSSTSSIQVSGDTVGIGLSFSNTSGPSTDHRLHVHYGSGTYGVLIEGGGAISENIPLRLWDTGTAASNTNVLEFAHATGSTPKSYVPAARVKSVNPASGATTGANLILETSSLSSPTSTTWNSNQLYLRNDGNVGIGTNTPWSYLTINTPGGTLYSDGTTGQHGLIIGSHSTGFNLLYMGSDETNDVAYLQASVRGGSTLPIVINPSGGNVGIGTVTPAAKLDVRGSSGIIILASASTTSDLVRITQTGTGNALVVEDSANPDSTQFVINSIGNVGIGANPSGGRLYVEDSTNTAIYALSYASDGITGRSIAGGYAGVRGQGPIGVYGFADSETGTMIGVQGFASEIETGSGTYIGGYFGGFSTNGTNYSLRLLDGTEGVDKLLTSVTADGHANWKSDIKVTSIIASASSTGDLVRITQTGTGNALVVEDSANPDATPFIVHTTGNVGVGTASPTNTLHVQGSMKLTGTFSGNNSNFVEANLITQTVLLYMSNNT